MSFKIRPVDMEQHREDRTCKLVRGTKKPVKDIWTFGNSRNPTFFLTVDVKVKIYEHIYICIYEETFEKLIFLKNIRFENKEFLQNGILYRIDTKALWEILELYLEHTWSKKLDVYCRSTTRFPGALLVTGIE